MLTLEIRNVVAQQYEQYHVARLSYQSLHCTLRYYRKICNPVAPLCRPSPVPMKIRGCSAHPMCRLGLQKKSCRTLWPISTFDVGPDQPNPRGNPYPNPWGVSRSAGAVTRLSCVLWWRFSQKVRAGEKPTSTNTTGDLQQVFLQAARANRARRAALCGRWARPNRHER